MFHLCLGECRVLSNIMYLALVVLTFLPLLCNTQNSGVLSGVECTSPNNQRGSCTRLADCPDLLNLLRQARGGRQKSEAHRFLRSSQCGFEGRFPVVCCPGSSAKVVIPKVTTVMTPITRRPPPISNSVAPVATGRPNSALTMADHPNRNLLPDKCGNTPFSDTIIGGRNTSLGQYPWLAGLEYRTFRKPYVLCGGVLINNRYVVTAAHCLRGDKDTILTSVRLGDHDLESEKDCVNSLTGTTCADPVLNVRIEKSVPHPRYSSKSQHFDIGLIRLAQSVTPTDFIKPICLPSGSLSQDTFAGKRLTVAGWGRTETSWQSRFKLSVVVPVITNDQCAQQYSNINVQLDSTQMCAGGEGGKDSCTGDSGGPLMTFVNSEDKWYISGVVSIGPKICGSEGQPGVYTRVGPFVNWIMDNLKP